jgi:inosine-uridine nucleoside N-ribohydrolase
MTRSRRWTAVVVAAVAALTASGPAHAATTGGSSAPRPTPVHLIIDTDLFSDADDVGALALAFALQRAGEARVLAVNINTRLDRPAVADASPRCAAAIAQFYGRPGMPIGATRPLHGTEVNPVDFITPCAALASSSTQVPMRALTMYRRVLAGQPDHSVVLVSLGYLANIANLLRSGADAFSPLTGAELIAAKVTQLVVMGGGYPSRDGENNFVGNPAAAKAVATHWPGPVVWDGYEVGDAIHTGQTISSTHPSDSPVRAAYEAFAQPGNWIYSYDLTAVYRAVRPADPAMTLSAVGTNTVRPDGSNQFRLDPSGDQQYVVLADAAGLDASIETLLDQVPPQTP